jgi:site-specific DNA-cytosine methylase
MLTNQFTLGLHHEITVDLFAGGGGTSTGIELGIGRHVDVAINHDPEAIRELICNLGQQESKARCAKAGNFLVEEFS